MEADCTDALEREAFEQTVVYAAKSALTTIKSTKTVRNEDSTSENEAIEEFGDNFCKDNKLNTKPRNSARRTSTVTNVTEYNRMAQRKKSCTSRKQSVILAPVKKVNGLKPEQLQEIKTSFNDMDVNKDGRLSRRELIMGAYRVGMNPTDEEVDDMMNSADKNKDGFIDFNEYVEVMKKNYVTVDTEREKMKGAFSLLDTDGDGFLSKKELTDILVRKGSGITHDDLDEILKDADIDGDEKIDFDEFVDSTICAQMF